MALRLSQTVVRLMEKHGVEAPKWEEPQALLHPTASVTKDYPLASVKREVEVSTFEQVWLLMCTLGVAAGALFLVWLGAQLSHAGVL